VPERSAFKVDMAIEKLKWNKSPGIHQNPAELIEAWVKQISLRSIHLLILFWKEEEVPEEWKEKIIVPIYMKGDKPDCGNYRGISLLSTKHKILFIIMLSRWNPHAEKINVDQ
jgi:hypothetical protein